MLSPLANGLYHNVIMQSGTAAALSSAMDISEAYLRARWEYIYVSFSWRFDGLMVSSHTETYPLQLDFSTWILFKQVVKVIYFESNSQPCISLESYYTKESNNYLPNYDDDT